MWVFSLNLQPEQTTGGEPMLKKQKTTGGEPMPKKQKKIKLPSENRVGWL